MAQRSEIAVVGTGPVGLVAALGLARAGWSTCLVGPAAAPSDGRTAALMAPSVDFLSGLGLWDELAAGAGPLRALRLVDDTGSLFRPPPVLFRAEEIGLAAFGWNVENARLIGSLGQEVSRTPALQRREANVEAARFGADGVALHLSDGTTLEAGLVVAADGRDSLVRNSAGIDARRTAYPQRAITTLLDHERPHDDISTEFHTRAGPFTLVPLPGRRSSLVWVTSPHHAARLLAADDSTFADAVERRSRSLLGRMAVAGSRGSVPLASVLAGRFAGPRLVLAGEAAHALPPIGAQGLNLGLADVAALLRILVPGSDPGEPARLDRYGRERRRDAALRSTAVDLLNRSLLRALLPLDALRGIGLGLLGGSGPLRRAVMRAGLPGPRAMDAAPRR